MKLTPVIFGHFIEQTAGANHYWIVRAADGARVGYGNSWPNAVQELAYTAADARQLASRDYAPGYHRKTVKAVLRAVRALSRMYHRQAYSIELLVQYNHANLYL